MKKIVCLLFAFFVVASCAIAGGVILSGCDWSRNPSLSQDYDDKGGDKTGADATYYYFEFGGTRVSDEANPVDYIESYGSIVQGTNYYDYKKNDTACGTVTVSYSGTSVSSTSLSTSYYGGRTLTGSVSGNVTFTLTYTVNSGYSFLGWYRYHYQTDGVENDIEFEKVSVDATYTFTEYGSSYDYSYSYTAYCGLFYKGTAFAVPPLPKSVSTYAYPSDGEKTISSKIEITAEITNYYGYGFSVNSSGYFESRNKGVNNSYAMMRIQFYARKANSTFTIKYISYAENNYDYAIFSNLDTVLSESSSADSTYFKRTYGESSANEKTLTYSGISLGSHYIYIKFIKDGSQHVGNDSLQVYFESDWIENSNYAYRSYNYVGTKFGTLPTATRSGYKLDGWYTSPSGGTKITSDSIITGSNINFYAHWSVATYTVTVVAGTGIKAVRLNNKSASDLKQDSESYAPGSPVTLRAQVSDGYEFSGWTVTSGTGIYIGSGQIVSFTMPSSDLTIRANATGKYLPLYIGVNGGTLNPDCYNAYAYSDYLTGGFTKNAQGFYESTNLGLHDSFALARVDFTLSSAQYVNIRAICYAEEGCDEGLISYMDKTFSGGVWWNVIDYDDEEECEYSSPWEMVRSVYCSAGYHYFYVKYTKDSSVNNNYDSLQFKIDNVSSYTVDSMYADQDDSDDDLYATPFKLTSDGYYTSTNKVDISFSYLRYNFTTKTANETVSFSCISYGENNYDYGIMSNLDTKLAYTNSLDSSGVYKSFKGQSSPSAVTVSYTVPTAGNHYITAKYIKDSSTNEYDDHFKIKFTTGYTKVVQVGGTYGTLPTPTKSNYTLKNWNSGSVTTTSTVAATSNPYVNITAYWTANSITNTVKLRVINKDGTYSNVDSNLGGTVTISRAVINSSQNGSSRSSTTQTLASNTYAVHQGQSFSFTGTAKAGYIFAGVSTSSTPTDAIKNPTAPKTTAISYTPTSGTTYYVYFKQVSDNRLKYDSEGKYYYFEDGYYPQSEVDSTLVSTLNSSATTNGESFTYNGGTENIEVPVYTYDGDRFVKLTARGETKWFKFEPIRWRVSDVGVSDSNADRPDGLKTYSSYKTNFIAVSDLILGFGAMHSTRAVGEGTVATDLDGFVQVQGAANNCSFDFNYAASQTTIDIQRYTTVGSSTVIDSKTINYSSPLRIVSTAELDEVGLTNRQAKASALVAFVLGLDEDRVTYWTRDLSNLGAGVAISQSGTTLRPWLDKMYGLRFAYTFTEGSNIAYYS